MIRTRKSRFRQRNFLPTLTVSGQINSDVGTGSLELLDRYGREDRPPTPGPQDPQPSVRSPTPYPGQAHL